MYERTEFERAVTPEVERQKNRIRYLEKSIEKMQLDHSESLIGLHNEIERLSTIVSGIFILMRINACQGCFKQSSRDGRQ
jgi:hypothetical protein